MEDKSVSAPATIGLYQIQGEIGRGATSVVYKAHRDGRLFALKLMRDVKAHGESADLSLRFRREAATLGRLSHPAFVRIIESGDAAGQPYIVMEYASGQSLDVATKAQPLSDDAIIDIGTQLAGALIEVHRFGLVHRDIKPSNIIVNPDGQVKLLDFGFAAGATDDRHTEKDVVVGTLFYGAPEQFGVIDRGVDARADLYGLGATLYEAVSGRPPYTAQSVGELLQLLATAPVPDLRAARANIRPMLAQVIGKLLAKDPDDRYQSAKGVLWDLEHLAQIEQSAHSTTPMGLGSHDSRTALAMEVLLCGRSAEVATTQQVWAEARAGKTRVLQVEGESGLGKTRLVRELVGTVREQGGLVLVGKCQESEKVPLGPLREAIDNFLAEASRLPGEQRESAVARVRAAAGADAAVVKRLSRPLGQVIGDVAELRPLDPEAERTRFLDGVAGFLQRLATSWGSGVLVVDDVQWIDDGTLDMLRRLCTAADTAPFLIATTARNDAQSEAARAQFVQTLGDENVTRIELKPLAQDAVGQMIAAFLGGPIDPAALGRIAQLTRGNPFVIGEYARVLVERGLVLPGPSHWNVLAQALNEDVLPRDVIQVVVKRFDALSPQAQSLVSTAALLGNRFSLALLSNAARLRKESTENALEEAVRATLLERINEDEYGFAHDKVREAASERISDAALPDLHQAIAEALSRTPVDSTEYTYAIARHWSLGRPERNPLVVVRACAAACAQAVISRDHETAYEFGRRALAAGLDGLGSGERMRLLESLGQACMETGRLDEAAGHLDQAVAFATDRFDQFRIQLLLTRTHASRGVAAWTYLQRAFEILGRPLPRTGIGRLLVFLRFLVGNIFHRLTGWGYGRATGTERELRKRFAEAHALATPMAVFDCDPLTLLQFVVRDLHNAHFLGTSEETAISVINSAAVFAGMGLKGPTYRRIAIAKEMAAQLGNPVVQAYCNAAAEVWASWCGDVNVDRLMSTVEELWQNSPGSWYAAMYIAERGHELPFVGRTRAAIDFYRRAMPHLEKTNCVAFRYVYRMCAYWQLAKCGRFDEAQEMFRGADALAPSNAAMVKYVLADRAVERLLASMEEEAYDVQFEELVEDYYKLKLPTDYYQNMGHLAIMFGRLDQFLRATGDKRARRQARRRLNRVVLTNTLLCRTPQYQCHTKVVKATIARADRKWDRARKLLAQADVLARKLDNYWGAYNVALERARLARTMNDPVGARAFAVSACELAVDQGWEPKLARVTQEFGLQAVAADRANATSMLSGTQTYATLSKTQSFSTLSKTQTIGMGGTISGLTSGTISGKSSSGAAILRGGDYLDALLQVSLASSSTLDADQQASKALAELTRVLHAERAMFFLVDPHTGEIRSSAVHGVDAGEIHSLRGYSSTIVRKVRDTREAIIVSGTDDAALLGSESAVTLGLRSIIAAPLLLHDKVVGVVYLDNRLARGFFTQEHIRILLGIGNHIAVALEMARAARMEAEKKALERDLELTGSVQTLLLPTAQSFEGPSLRTSAFYRPAAQCGGDWWWQDEPTNGEISLVLGDVTGHGAPAAMVTAAVAGTYHTERAHGVRDFGEVLTGIHRRILAMGGAYNMTMCALRVDTGTGAVRCWSAAAPPLLVWRHNEKRVDSIVTRGTSLGSGAELSLGSADFALAPGDRVLAFTDGLSEQSTPGGRLIGVKRVARMLSDAAELDLTATRAHMVHELDTLVGGETQGDDITFVLMERV